MFLRATWSRSAVPMQCACYVLPEFFQTSRSECWTDWIGEQGPHGPAQFDDVLVEEDGNQVDEDEPHRERNLHQLKEWTDNAASEEIQLYWWSEDLRPGWPCHGRNWIDRILNHARRNVRCTKGTLASTCLAQMFSPECPFPFLRRDERRHTLDVRQSPPLQPWSLRSPNPPGDAWRTSARDSAPWCLALKAEWKTCKFGTFRTGLRDNVVLFLRLSGTRATTGTTAYQNPKPERNLCGFLPTSGRVIFVGFPVTLLRFSRSMTQCPLARSFLSAAENCVWSLKSLRERQKSER